MLQRPTRTGELVPAHRHSIAATGSLTTTETVVGQTTHFVVYSDGSADGNAAAQAVLASCEADFTTVQGWFGGLTLPPGVNGDDQTTIRTAQPMYVLMDPNAGGAYHYACNATDLYIEPAPANQATGLVVAEEVEVFEAAINNGWDCGHTNGEGLSRVLAVERNPNLSGITVPTETGWWSNGHNDYVNDNSADDQNQDGNGCGTLFLYYLHSQLGFSWAQITTAGGATLGACYQKLTGKDPTAGFQDFLGRLATLNSGGQISVPNSGNPFPIGSTAPVPATGGGLSGGVLVGAAIVVVIILVIIGLVTHVI